MRMRIVFFGIYQIGVNSLHDLLGKGLNIVAVVTKPETDIGSQPVALCAKEQKLPLLVPDSPRETSFIESIRELHPDLMVVAGYHKIIPKAVLDIPSWGTINLHGSLLPEYRGPNTWKWAIMNGETSTGVTVHMMTPQLDNGDILAQRVIPISDDETGGSLFDKISVAGAALLVETVDSIQRGDVIKTPQDESRASYYGYPTDQETRIDWEKDAREIRNLIRGVNPSPGAWTVHKGQCLRLWAATIGSPMSEAPPGTIVEITSVRIVVATGTSDLIIDTINRDGTQQLPWLQVVEHLDIAVGDRFESRDSD